MINSLEDATGSILKRLGIKNQNDIVRLKNATFEIISEFPNTTINVCADGPKLLIHPNTSEVVQCLTREQWIEKLWSELQLSPFHYPIIILNFLIFLFGTTGNIFVCLSVYRNHQLRSVTNYFIVNLAFADLLVIIICLPATVIWDLSLTWFFGTLPCKLIMFLQDVSISVSVLTLAAISVDRFYAICHPLKFKSNLSQAKRVIALIWLISLLIMMPDVIYLRAKQADDLAEASLDTVLYSDCNYDWSECSSKVFQFVKTILLYLLPFILMFCAHFRIMRTLQRASVMEEEEQRRRGLNLHKMMALDESLMAPRGLVDSTEAGARLSGHPEDGRLASALQADRNKAPQRIRLALEPADLLSSKQAGTARSGSPLKETRFECDTERAKQPAPSSSPSARSSPSPSPSTCSAGRARAEGLFFMPPKKIVSRGRKLLLRTQAVLLPRQASLNQSQPSKEAAPASQLVRLQTRASCDWSLGNEFRLLSVASKWPSRRQLLRHQQELSCNSELAGYSIVQPEAASYHGSTSESCRQAPLEQLRITMHNKSKLESRRKAAKMLMAIVIMFGICYLPVHLINFLRQFIDDIPQTDVTSTISMLAHSICYLNSAINPIIYNHMNSIFRAEFSKFLSCFPCRKNINNTNKHQPAGKPPFPSYTVHEAASRPQNQVTLDSNCKQALANQNHLHATRSPANSERQLTAGGRLL